MKYDLLGLGNALVDCLGKCADNLIDEVGLEKGTMALVESGTTQTIFSNLTDTEIKSGGSVANTMAGFSALGGKSAFVGRVGADKLGGLFIDDMNGLNIDFVGQEKSPNQSGSCTIMVTPDGERTMATYLGASVEFGEADLDLDLLQQSKIVYMEGYLFDAPTARSCFNAVAKYAVGTDTKVAFTLSDIFVVERHREDLFDFVKNSVDILFGNEEEIKYLMETDNIDDAVEKIKSVVPTAVITLGGDGAMAVVDGEVKRVGGEDVNVVDTTGAGDQFAGGFLYGYSSGATTEQSLKMGVALASSVITHMGGRLTANAKDLIAGI